MASNCEIGSFQQPEKTSGTGSNPSPIYEALTSFTQPWVNDRGVAIGTTVGTAAVTALRDVLSPHDGHQPVRDTADPFASAGADAPNRHGNTAGRDSTRLIATGALPKMEVTDPRVSARTLARDHLNPEQQLKSAEAQIKAAASAITDTAQRERFLKDLQTFSDRKLPMAEQTRTLDHITDLLTASDHAGSATREQRILGARSLMYNVANPDTQAQRGGTCGVGFEHHLLTRSPSIAAAVVNWSLCEGSWTGRDGIKITVPKVNFTVGDEQRDVPPSNGRASYASQVFQATAVNDIGQHLKPPMRYEVTRNNAGSLHEEWVWTDAQGREQRRNFAEPGTGVFSRTGGLTSAEVGTELARLAGDRGYFPVILNPHYDHDTAYGIPGVYHHWMLPVGDERTLGILIERLQKHDLLHIPVSVSARGIAELVSNPTAFNALVRTQEGRDKLVPDHFVNIHGYRVTNGKQEVLVHNQWGPKFNGWVPVSGLFLCLGQKAQEEPRNPGLQPIRR